MKTITLKNNLAKLLILISFIFLIDLSAKNCAQYYDPQKFYDAPEVLADMLSSHKYAKNFTIEKKELYKYEALTIAEEINNDFGGFWNDYTGEDGYEMLLLPEYNFFKYKNKYFSLRIVIYGVSGDASNLEATTIKYSFYDYTNEVLKYKKCKKENN